MLQLDGNVDVYKMECNRMLKYNIIRIRYWWQSQTKRDHWEDRGVGGFIILKWILERKDGVVWIGSIWLRIEITEGSC
jgi:hypothetical protein